MVAAYKLMDIVQTGWRQQECVEVVMWVTKLTKTTIKNVFLNDK